MRYFILITEQQWTLDRFREKLMSCFEVRTPQHDMLTIREPGNYAWLMVDSTVAQEYSPVELDPVGSSAPHFYILRFRSIRFVKRVLRRLVNDPAIWVDLDHPGEPIVSGPDLLQRLAREPDWLLGVATTTGD